MTDPKSRAGNQSAGWPTEGPRRPPEARASSRRRQALQIVGLAVAGLVLLAAGAGTWIYQHLSGNLGIFDGGGIAGDRPPVGPADADGGHPVNVLLLGSDSRADGNDDLGGGDIGAGHSDTAILLHVYADHRHAVGVSVPRDSLVDIPPCRLPNGSWTRPQHDQMFNSAFSVGDSPRGNPACTQNTVETMTGLRVNHTVVVDFKGFAAMASAVGGVPVCVPNDVNGYGMHLKKGRQTLAGQQALDFVRARHGLGDGSDIGRMKRQQAFLSALIKKIQDRGFDLTTLLPLAEAATRSLTVDPDLGSPLKLASFAQSLRSVKLADITFVTAPWRFSGERVALVHPDVDTLWTLLRQDRTLDGRSTGQASTGQASAPAAGGAASAPVATATATAGPADPAVPVTVQNGTKAAGLVGKAARELRAAGYQDVTAGGNAIAHAVTTIGYAPGHQPDAEQLARLFPGADLRPDPTYPGVSVILGHDYDSAASAAATGSGSSSDPATSATPSPTGGVPSAIAQNTRPADADACSDLTFGQLVASGPSGPGSSVSPESPQTGELPRGSRAAGGPVP